MIFARIGHGPCYYHWNEIFAGVHMVRARIPELVISESINCLRLKRRRKITESTGWLITMYRNDFRRSWVEMHFEMNNHAYPYHGFAVLPSLQKMSSKLYGTLMNHSKNEKSIISTIEHYIHWLLIFHKVSVYIVKEACKL